MAFDLSRWLAELANYAEPIISKIPSWDTAYNRSSVSLSLGTMPNGDPALVLTKQDGTTLKVSLTDLSAPESALRIAADLLKADKTYVDSQDAIINNLITVLKGGSTETIASLKTAVDAINGIIGSAAPDADSFVNTVKELLAVFATFPEGVDILGLIGSKINISDIVNNLSQVVTGKVLDAAQGKILNDLITANAVNIAANAVNIASKVDKVIGKSLILDTEIARLAGMATGATANSTDAQLRDRATHTGFQPISTVTGLQADLDAKASSIAANTTNITNEINRAVAADSTLTGQVNAKANASDISPQIVLTTANFTTGVNGAFTEYDNTSFYGKVVNVDYFPRFFISGQYLQNADVVNKTTGGFRLAYSLDSNDKLIISGTISKLQTESLFTLNGDFPDVSFGDTTITAYPFNGTYSEIQPVGNTSDTILTKIDVFIATSGILRFILATKNVDNSFTVYYSGDFNVIAGLNTIVLPTQTILLANSYYGKMGMATGYAQIKGSNTETGAIFYSVLNAITNQTILTSYTTFKMAFILYTGWKSLRTIGGNLEKHRLASGLATDYTFTNNAGFLSIGSGLVTLNNIVNNDIAKETIGAYVSTAFPFNPIYTQLEAAGNTVEKLITKITFYAKTAGNLKFILATKNANNSFNVYYSLDINVIAGLNTAVLNAPVSMVANSYYGNMGLPTGGASLGGDSAATGLTVYSVNQAITNTTILSASANFNLAIQIFCGLDSVKTEIKNIKDAASVGGGLSTLNNAINIDIAKETIGSYPVTTYTFSAIWTQIMSVGNTVEKFLTKVVVYVKTPGVFRFVLAVKNSANTFTVYYTKDFNVIAGNNTFDLGGTVTVRVDSYYGNMGIPAGGAEIGGDNAATGKSMFAVNQAIIDTTVLTNYPNYNLAIQLYTGIDSLKTQITKLSSGVASDNRTDILLSLNCNDKVSPVTFTEGYISSVEPALYLQPKLSIVETGNSLKLAGSALNFGNILQGEFSKAKTWSVEMLVQIDSAAECFIISKQLTDTTKKGFSIQVKNDVNGVPKFYASLNGDLTQNVSVQESLINFFTYATAVSVPDGMNMYSQEPVQAKRIYHLIVQFIPANYNGTSNSAAPGFRQPLLKMYINGREQSHGTPFVSPHVFTPLTADCSNTASLLVGGFSGTIDFMNIYRDLSDYEYLYQNSVKHVFRKAPSRPSIEDEKAPVNIIIDLDIDTDADDLGDVQVSYALHRQKEINLLGYVCSTRQPYAPAAVEAIVKNWWGDTLMPIAAYKGSRGTDGGNTSIGAKVAIQFNPGRTRANFPDDLIKYRQLLNSAADNSVVIIITGFLISVERLMKSDANGLISNTDTAYLASDVSDGLGITGMDLIKKKVKCMLVVGDTFPSAMSDAPEYNAHVGDAPGWKYAIDKFPKPIVYSGGETGNFVWTAPTRISTTDDTNNPVVWGYIAHNGNTGRGAWATMLALLAARGSRDLFSFSMPCFVDHSSVSGSESTMLPIRYDLDGNRWFLRFNKGFLGTSKIYSEIVQLLSIRP